MAQRRHVAVLVVVAGLPCLATVGCGHAGGQTGGTADVNRGPTPAAASSGDASGEPRPAVERTPQSFSRIVDAVDLRAIPIPENAEVSARHAGEYQINREEDVADSVAFIRDRLGALGCTQVPWPEDTLSAEIKYLLFEKDGYLLTAFASPYDRDGFKSSVSILNVGNLDATTLPHPPGSPAVEEKFRGVYAVTGDGSIADNAARLRAAFAAAGWREYRFAAPPGSGPESGPDDTPPMFMRGGIGIRGYLAEQNGQTLARLNSVVLRAELPLPAGVRDVRIDSGLHASLSCESDASLTDTLGFYRQHFASLGWRELPDRAATSADKAKALRIDVEGLVDKQPADLQLAVARAEERRLRALTNPVELPLPPAAADVTVDEKKRLARFTTTATPREAVAFFEERFKTTGWEVSESNADGKQGSLSVTKGDDSAVIVALKLDDTSPTSVDASAYSCTWLVRDAATPANAAAMRSAAAPERSAATVRETSAIEPLVVDDVLIPGNRTDFQTAGSRYRARMHATTPSTPAEILAFYREHLRVRGWQEKPPAPEGGPSTLVFTGDAGSIRLVVTAMKDETTIDLDFARTAAAREAGLLPESGRVLVVMANESSGEVKVAVNGQTTVLAAGLGARKPDGPRVSLPPGTHAVTVTYADGRTETESIEAGRDQTWALVVTPDGPVVTDLY